MGIFYQYLQGRVASLQIETPFFLLKCLIEEAKTVNTINYLFLPNKVAEAEVLCCLSLDFHFTTQN